MTDTPPSIPYVPGPTQPTTGALPPIGPPTAYQPPVAPPAWTAAPAPWTTGQLPAQPPPQRGNRGLLIVIAAFLGLLVVIGGAVAVWVFAGGKTPIAAVQDAASKNAAPQTYQVTGTITLNDGYSSSGICQGKGGYRDIGPGAQITITDANGATIAVGQLGAGRIENGACVFGFEVKDVPAGKGFYGIEISHRGVLKYPEAEFGAKNLHLTLG